jgi:hypothetical protein
MHMLMHLHTTVQPQEGTCQLLIAVGQFGYTTSLHLAPAWLIFIAQLPASALWDPHPTILPVTLAIGSVLKQHVL